MAGLSNPPSQVNILDVLDQIKNSGALHAGRLYVNDNLQVVGTSQLDGAVTIGAGNVIHVGSRISVQTDGNTGVVKAWAGNLRLQALAGSKVPIQITGEVNQAISLAPVTIIKVHTSDLFDAAALTDSVVIWAQPANSVVLGIKMVLNTRFVAAGLTDLDVTIGNGGNNAGFMTEAMNLITDAITTEYSTRGAHWSAATVAGWHSAAGENWTAYATAVGANLSTTSAGQVTFYITYTQF